MRCQRVIEILSTHSRLIPAHSSARVVQDHLETCPTCAYWEQTARDAIQAMGTDADVEAPEPLRRILEVKMQEREVEHV